jgi:dihydroneopterin aldolase
MINLSQHDYIEINTLEMLCPIGVHRYEKTFYQNLKFDIKIFKDFSDIPDKIDATVDYSIIQDELTKAMKNKHFELLETLANFIADWINIRFQTIACEVKIKKFHIVPDVSFVGVRACRFAGSASAKV